jgi:hypothetical protein
MAPLWRRRRPVRHASGVDKKSETTYQLDGQSLNSDMAQDVDMRTGPLHLWLAISGTWTMIGRNVFKNGG